MKKLSVLFCLLSSVLGPHFASAQAPQVINYQGRLLNGTNLVNGSVGLSLRLFNQSSGGTSLYEDSNTVTVVDGLYSTMIGDNPTNAIFLNALTNPAVWVEVAVNGVALSPRERIAAVGYSLATRGLLVTTNESVIHLPFLNSVGIDSHGATIGGGRYNVVQSNSAVGTIAGGEYNVIDYYSWYNTIGGGFFNSILYDADYAVVVGGRDNQIQTNSDYSAVAGGYLNRIGSQAYGATILGGENNSIGSVSDYATIAGGRNNAVGTNAPYALAAGYRAKARHRGTLVWGDTTEADVASTTNNQATFRASGGFRVLNGPLQAGAGLQVSTSGTTITRLQAGTAILGPGTNLAVYTVAFPNAFTTPPRVMVSTRNDPLFNVSDTFVATVRSVTTTNFVLNVIRVDVAASWAQQLRAEWLAWE